MRFWSALVGSVAVAVVAGCASSPAPTEKLEATSASIRAAQEVGAPRVPAASLHLQLALEQTEHAKTLMAKGEKKQASSLLMRAEVDAELALALAREDTERTQAQQAYNQVRALRQNP